MATLKETIKKKQRTFICGIPLIEKCVYDVVDVDKPPSGSSESYTKDKRAKLDQQDQFRVDKPPSGSSESYTKDKHAKLDQQDQFRGIKDFLTSNTSVVIFIGSVLVLILAYCSIQYIAILNCPEKLRLDKSEDSLRQYQAKLNEMERALNTTRQQNEKLNKDVAEITASKDGFARKVKEAEAELGSLKRDLESAKQQENKLREENENLKSEKDTISKDLSATKYTLGNCKNKNMDHEVRSLELLQEIEGLKKELKAC